MQRGEIGSYEVTSVGGERVRAFVPLPLPPKPDLVLDGSLQQVLESAVLALGRLDAVSTCVSVQGSIEFGTHHVPSSHAG